MQTTQRSLARLCSRACRKLHDPVHDALSWLAVAAISASSLLIITTALAQTETLNRDSQIASTSLAIIHNAPCGEKSCGTNSLADGYIAKPDVALASAGEQERQVDDVMLAIMKKGLSELAVEMEIGGSDEDKVGEFLESVSSAENLEQLREAMDSLEELRSSS